MRSIYQILFIFVVLGPLGWANPQAPFGFGGLSTGRVGGGLADPRAPFAVGLNPALLSQSKRQFEMSASAASARYDALGPVRVDGPQYRSGSGRDQFGEASVPAHSGTVWTLGYQSPFRLGEHRGGFGGYTSGPLGEVRGFVARTPYDFTNLRYGDSRRQLRASLGGGIEVIPGWLSLGLGLNLFLSTAGAAELTLAGQDPTGRLALDVNLNSSAVAGLWFGQGPSRVSVVYRQKVSPSLKQRFTGQVQIGSEQVLSQPVLIQSSLYFEPESWEAEWQYERGRASVEVGVAIQRWEDFEPPFLLAESRRADGGLSQTQIPDLPLKTTVSPRVSGTWKLADRWIVGSGYSYRPTPLTSLSGPTNLVDTNTHVVGLGVTFQVAKEWQIGLAGQHHFFENRTVTKDSDQFIGAPGYRVAGSASSVGVSLRAPL